MLQNNETPICIKCIECNVPDISNFIIVASVSYHILFYPNKNH